MARRDRNGEDYPVQVQIISVAKKSLFMVTPTTSFFLILLRLAKSYQVLMRL